MMTVFKNQIQTPITHRRAARSAIVVLVILGISFWITQSAIAGSPDDPFADPIPSGQLEAEKTIILAFDLQSETTGQLVNIGGQIINSIPESYIGTPFMWTGKVTTFDNQCPYAFPLYHPRLVSMDHFNADEEPDWGGWYRTGSDVDFVLSIPFIPTATEVEILDSALVSRGIFDINPLLDAFCEENSDDLQCEERRNKFYELFDLDEVQTVIGAITINFDELEHNDGWGEDSLDSNFDENVLHITSSEPVNSFAIALDLSQTDLSETYLNQGYAVGSDKNIAISLHGDKDSFVTMKFEQPIGGIAMYLGLVGEKDYDSTLGPTNVSQVVGDAPFGSDAFRANFVKLNMSPKQHDDEFDGYVDDLASLEVVGKEASINLDEPVIALIRGFDSEGELVGELDTKLPSYPGIYQFWGFGAPFTSIMKVELEFRSDVFNETFDKMVILPEHFEKLIETRMDLSDCDGPVATYGSMELPPILPPELPRPQRVTSPAKDVPLVVPMITGDLDASGSFTLEDIKMLLKVIVRIPLERSNETAKPSDRQMEAVDIYPRSRGGCGDGKLNIFDALALLRSSQAELEANPCKP